MKQYKAYVFDFDGTLIDSYESLVYVFQSAYKSVGINVDKNYVWRLMRIPLETGYLELNAPMDKTNIFAEAIVKYLNSDKTLKLTKLYSDTLPLLTRLKKANKTLGIVTSNSSEHVIDVLKLLGVDPSIFSTIIGNGECKKRKPNPDPLLAAINELNVSKEETVYIGDALDDMICAKQAQIDNILLDRLHEYSDAPYLTINSLDEIIIK